MAIKCIAIGNRIMSDDSIGIRVLEAISPQLKQENITVIFGETDVDYALSKIEEDDLLFILDSTYFNKTPGTVSVTPIDQAIEQQKQVYSQHQPSLINFIKIYKKSVLGFIIGIEVNEVQFGFELSDILSEKFTDICLEVSTFIQDQIRGF